MPAYFADYVARAPARVRPALAEAYNPDVGFTVAAVAQEVMQSLFTPQPTGPSYHRSGFLLEGFPRCPVEMDVLLNQFHVDAIVSVELEPELCVPRIVKQMIAATRAKGAPWTLDEDQEDDLKEQLMEKCNKENMQYVDLTSVLENSSIPVLGIDGTRSMRYSLAKLRKFLAPFLALRANLLLQAAPLRTPTHLASLLHSGAARYSVYGTQCPVSYMRNERFLDGMAYLHQGVVYHVHPKHAAEFVQNVSAYLALPAPRLAVQPTLCLLGPPMTGKQTLAAKLAESHGLTLLTPEVVVQSILDGQEQTRLHDEVGGGGRGVLFTWGKGLVAMMSDTRMPCMPNTHTRTHTHTHTHTPKQMRAELQHGKLLPQPLLLEAILTVTQRLDEVGRGWVMVGYPETMEQVQVLQGAGWKPKAMFQLGPLPEEELAARLAAAYLRDTR